MKIIIIFFCDIEGHFSVNFLEIIILLFYLVLKYCDRANWVLFFKAESLTFSKGDVATKSFSKCSVKNLTEAPE